MVTWWEVTWFLARCNKGVDVTKEVAKIDGYLFPHGVGAEGPVWLSVSLRVVLCLEAYETSVHLKIEMGQAIHKDKRRQHSQY